MNKILDKFLSQSLDQVIQEYEKNQVMSSKQAKRTFEYFTDVAAGKVPTTAAVIRRLIQANPLYKKDSILSDVVSCYPRKCWTS